MRKLVSRHAWSAAVALFMMASRPVMAQELGSWSPIQTLPVAMTQAMLLPNGKVLFWGNGDAGGSPYFWDPATGQLSEVAAPGFNMSCGGHALLPDGRVLGAGGSGPLDERGLTTGLRSAAVFDPIASSWSGLTDMSDGRLCPSAIALPNGDVLVLSGQIIDGSATIPMQLNPLPEVFEVATESWRGLSGVTVQPPIHSRAFLAPDGRAFLVGPQVRSYWVVSEGTGASSSGPFTALGVERTYGTAVMYDAGKILIAGGGATPTETAESIDLNEAEPAWSFRAPMAAPRRHHNATVLPDGTVLVTGGTQSGALFNDASGAVLEAELWDPATDTWTRLAPAAAFRGYDSTALLLPDGRVLAGGGRGTAGLHLQVYSPPHLSRGARPAVEEVPEAIWPDAPFLVKTPDSAGIAKVSLVRLGAVTHSWDSGQRFVPLSFTAEGAQGLGLIVTGPRDNNVAPAGYYMLFVVNSEGVPSVGKMVRVVHGPTAGPAPELEIDVEEPAEPVPGPGAGGGAPKAKAPERKSKGGCVAAGGGMSLPLAALPAALLLLRRRRSARR